MTATTVTADRPATRCDGFGSLLYAEWTKFRTVRGWVTAMVIAALLTAGVGIWAASGSHGQPCGRILPDGQVVGGRCASRPLGPGGEMVTDSFYFVRQPLSGNGTITARVTALAGASSAQTQGTPVVLQPWAKAGIIIKASLRQGSAYAAMMVTGGHGVRMQYDYTRDIAGLPGGVSGGSPRWLRLVRSGDIAPAVASSAGSGRPADQGIIGAFAGLIVVLVVGTMFITSEYRHGLIRTTLTATPRRGQVLAALGAILRHGAGPVTVTIALIVVPYFFTGPLAILRGTAAQWLLRITPAAAFAVQQVLPAYHQVSNAYSAQYGYYPLPPWAGLAVLCAWTALALGMATFLLRRRDA